MHDVSIFFHTWWERRRHISFIYLCLPIDRWQVKKKFPEMRFSNGGLTSLRPFQTWLSRRVRLPWRISTSNVFVGDIIFSCVDVNDSVNACIVSINFIRSFGLLPKKSVPKLKETFFYICNERVSLFLKALLWLNLKLK